MTQRNMITLLISGTIVILSAELVRFYLSGEQSNVWWYIGTLVSPGAITIAVLLLSPTQVKRLLHFYRMGVALFSITCILLYFLTYMGYSVSIPLEQLFDNKNFLAAGLAFNGLAALLADRKHRSILFVISALSLVLVGSRSALLSYVSVVMILGSLSVFKQTIKVRSLGLIWLALASIVLVLAAPTLASPFLKLVVESQRNLLTETQRVAGPRWTSPGGTYQVIELPEVPAPALGGGHPLRITSQSRPEAEFSRIALAYSIGTSSDFATYIASVWLRSDSEDSVVYLSNNLESVACPVQSDWRRCIIGPSPGDGLNTVQWQLRYAEGATELDVILWGPQLESGTHVTPVYQVNFGHSFQRWLSDWAARFSITTWLDDSSVLSRLEAFRRSAELIIARPITGHGKGSFKPFDISDGDYRLHADHPHNTVLLILVERGVIGLSVTIAIIALVVFVLRAVNLRTLAVLLLILLMNLFDDSFFRQEVYYSLWFIIATMNHPLESKSSSLSQIP